MSTHRGPAHSTGSTTVADLLERVLDKGVVIAGDVKVKLLDIELLTIQLRLVICSIDKAKEMGMDWWVNNPVFSAQPAPPALPPASSVEPGPDPAYVRQLEERLALIEGALRGDERAAQQIITPASPVAPSRPASPHAAGGGTRP